MTTITLTKDDNNPADLLDSAIKVLSFLQDAVTPGDTIELCETSACGFAIVMQAVQDNLEQAVNKL